MVSGLLSTEDGLVETATGHVLIIEKILIFMDVTSDEPDKFVCCSFTISWTSFLN